LIADSTAPVPISFPRHRRALLGAMGEGDIDIISPWMNDPRESAAWKFFGTCGRCWQKRTHARPH